MLLCLALLAPGTGCATAQKKPKPEPDLRPIVLDVKLEGSQKLNAGEIMRWEAACTDEREELGVPAHWNPWTDSAHTSTWGGAVCGRGHGRGVEGCEPAVSWSRLACCATG